MDRTTGRKTDLFKVIGYALVIALCVQFAGGVASDEEEYYRGQEQVYSSRPEPGEPEIVFGNIGVSGLLINFYQGVVVKVDKTLPNTPAAGKFKPGQIITGVNGVKLHGKNPVPILGKAVTKAEATDGLLIFDVKDNEKAPEKKVRVSIPVLGAYSSAWPLNCEKSKKIIQSAAEFYWTNKEFRKEYFERREMGGAFACLFLLSTGEDKYLPYVKEYFEQFLGDIEDIGHNTWFNGYNGIACAEYYLRTGDTSVLPILQYYCDDAKRRQSFGCGWGHWGMTPSPGYVASGLMNPAGAQVLTTLLLGKECGVNVDDETLIGALRFMYRFVGHGTVPYGDHRSEGGLGSNGKDGMLAAAMQVASGAQGDVSIYEQAKRHLAMSMIVSYPVMVSGHGDEGRGDAIWRGIASAYALENKPGGYHTAMNRLRWWYDLCRRSSGSFGVSLCPPFNDDGSGAAVAMTYTAPLRTLRITGAPRSKYAKKFTLPEHLWGTQADEAFLSIENNPEYKKYGKPEPIHIPFFKLGSAYSSPNVDLEEVPRKEMIKNIYHSRYLIRTQAAKALRTVGALDVLEGFLTDPDPRVRRAALDGITGYKYWSGERCENPIEEEDISEAMIEAIKKMLTDRNESLWVVDRALVAMELAPAKTINENLPIIMPWLTHDEWWLRESAFTALFGMRKDDKLFLKVLPAMLDMIAKEYHTMPRGNCLNRIKSVWDETDKTSPISKTILAGLVRAVKETEIKPDRDGYHLSAEGGHNVMMTIGAYLERHPETAAQTAKMVRDRFASMQAFQIVDLVASPNCDPEGEPFGLYSTLKILEPAQSKELRDILINDYRPELIRRLNANSDEKPLLADTIIDLLKLKDPDAGWQPIGKVKPADQVWRFMSFNPRPDEKVHPREKKRFRKVTLPSGLEKWYMPGFDDSKWKTGKAPIGIGVFESEEITFKNNSDWGDGEFLLMRTTFEVEDLDYGSYRVCVLMKQGFDLYLNGEKFHTYVWWKDLPHYRPILFGPGEVELLKKGKNVLAAYCNVEYVTGETIGQADVYIEGLEKSALRE